MIGCCSLVPRMEGLVCHITWGRTDLIGHGHTRWQVRGDIGVSHTQAYLASVDC
jgi:hypothetical protein